MSGACSPPSLRSLIAGSEAPSPPAFSAVYPGEILPGFSFDFTYVLPLGDTLTGTPAVAVDTTGLPSSATIPTFSSIAISAGIAGTARAVSWTTTVPAKTSSGIYPVKVTAASAGGATLIRAALLPVGNS